VTIAAHIELIARRIVAAKAESKVFEWADIKALAVWALQQGQARRRVKKPKKKAKRKAA